MRKVWIVVANASLAKIYHAENASKIVENKTLQHPESHLFAHDLVSDKPGCNTSAGKHGLHPIEAKTSPKLKEKQHFASELASCLEQGLQDGKFERLYLIANPTFLGELRSALSTHVTKTIHAEVPKDLTQLKADAIREYLPPVL